MTQASPEAEQTSSPSQSPSPPSPAEQISSEFKERVQRGLEKAGVRKVLDDVADSDVLDEDPPPPKERKPASGAAKPGPPGAAAAEKKPSGEGKEASEGDADRPRPQPRYDSKSFGKWVTNNPEAAAELAAKVFKTQLGDKPDAWKSQFIAFENKRRRQSEADEKERAEIEAQKGEIERLAKEAREPVEDIITLIEAEAKEEYPAIDKFIETTFKVNFDEYCRRRLRGINKETPTERAQKQKIAALEAKLAEKDKTPAKEPEKEAAPKVSQKWVEREVGSDHGVRDLSDWQKRVSEAYEASRDEESGDYDITIEDAADQVLAEFLKKRAGKTETAQERRPAARQRPREQRREPKEAKTWSDDDEDAEASSDPRPEQDWSRRLSSALARAGRRAS